MQMSKHGRSLLFQAATSLRRHCAALLMLTLWLGGAAIAQTPRGIYAPGDAAVTGFSGAVRPFEIAPGQDPASISFIDPNGPALRVIDLTRMGGPAQAQVVGAPKPFTVSAALIGQVFGVALDDRAPANIYVAASSAYGLSIVAPGPDGHPQRVQRGGKDAAFMPGQWGPGGGPGSIWKVDGVTGLVSLFATITNDGKGNSGAALGGLAYDPGSQSLYVADRESGLIHRFAPDGSPRGVYDHGVAGLKAVGLETVPPPSLPAADITSAEFDSASPASWGFASPERRVFGLAVRDRRLYYAVADGLRVWSVGLSADGSFAADARIELAAPPAAGPTEIAKIDFDDSGRMYLAERAAPTGAQDYQALAVPAIGRLLRYTVIGVTESKQPIWQLQPDEYAVGFAGDFRNDNGGVAIGYRYDARGDLNRDSCGGFVWTSGEQLRAASDPALAAELARSGSAAINGLQGMPIWHIRRNNEPPRASYFIDYADAPPNPAARGHLGDIAILRQCQPRRAMMPFEGAPERGVLTPGLWTCRSHVCTPGGPACPVNQVWNPATGSCTSGCAPQDVLINGQCCSPKDLRPGGACKQPSTNIGKPMCGTTQTPIGPNNECCENSQIYAGGNGQQLCCSGTVVNGTCDPQQPKLPICLDCCAPGYVKSGGKCCLQSQLSSKGKCCPLGQTPSADGSCQPWKWLPKLSLCCASGFVPTAKGSCCAAANLTTSGECCPAALDPNDRSQCPTKSSPPAPCPRGERRDASGACVTTTPTPPATVIPVVPRRPVKCLPGERRNAQGVCVPRRPPPGVVTPGVMRPIACPPGFAPGPYGQRCFPIGRGGRFGPPPFRGGGGAIGPGPNMRGGMDRR
jgi:hypothetical protein